ncbi:putative 1-phosphatidylinositol 4-kinase [Rhodotorula taiwanensis]|uniref:1-phosphatidylinositol 4-kinase n=1 Tax=Rhodotorula taiwanensis TaxID=741276 RepID=A0A2S5BCJ7_9BASI|nr:putative 1-phosphatidylinositol 4-kinase [Rhodotorula taiwanensis]
MRTYSTSIGISHYLVNRLRLFEYEDVEFYWPQLWSVSHASSRDYLVITRTTPSNALENFILERCQEDSHIAVITLWYLQASLSELSQSPQSDQFAACRRVLNRVQEIIFTDPPAPSASSNGTVSLDVGPAESKRKVNAPLASFVGIGVLLAAIGMPVIVNATGGMIVEQGQRLEQVTKSDDAGDIGLGEKGRPDPENSGSDDEELWDHPPEKANKGRPKSISRTSSTTAASAKGSTSTSRASKPPQTPAKRTQTQPNYLPGDRIVASPRIPLAPSQETRSMSFLPSPLLSRANSKSGSTSDGKPVASGPSSKLAVTEGGGTPALQRRASAASRLRPGAPPSLSVPSLPISHSAGNLLGSPATNSHHLSGATLPGYGLPKPFLSRLLLLQACRSQLDLLRSLQDISTRLVLVPKPARLSSLRAELTVLNHGLPRGCSLGMSTRSPVTAPAGGATQPAPPTFSVPSSPFEKPHPRKPRRKQARVIRISPSESVVLNSADRAPFVIYVEVLEEDLDFDPDRRSNWEDLRRALRERDGLSTPASGTLTVNGEGQAAYGSAGQSARASVDSALESYGKSTPASTGRRDAHALHSAASPGSPSSPTPGTPFIERAEYALGSDLADPAGTAGQEPPEPSDEMDLVEQLYGDVSLRDDGAFVEQSEPDEVEIHNRDADEAAWKRKDEEARSRRRRSSATSAGSSAAARTARLSISGANGVLHSETPASPPRPTRKGSDGIARPGGRSIASRAPISLDDYAERMRMAAIMLAQLDASQTASRGVVGAGTAAAGTLVTLPVATVAGVGGLVGYGLGAGFGAVKARLTKKETPVATAGQAGAGKLASLDTASAAEGTSAVAGQPPLNAQVAALSQHAAEAASKSGVAPSSSTAVTNGSHAPAHASIPTQRPRVLSPQDAAAIRERIMSEMLSLEEERMERMRYDAQSRSYNASTGAAGKEDNTVVMRAVSKDDPSGAVFAESYTAKTARIRAASPFGHLANWSLLSCIVKTGADLRQEQLAVQLISEFGRIWKEENCPGWIYYFRIMVTSENSGLIETINDSVSVHSLKKNAYARRAEDGTQVFESYTLYDYFLETYGPVNSSCYRKAQDAFIESLAAYSVICYLLQLKDRHNGNILVDKDGHLIHIDFGFMLSNSPGSIGFEMAPFKLPQDYIDILGGFDSPQFGEFRKLFKQCFRDARKHAERIITLVELMQKDSKLPCFANGDLTSQQLRERFMLSLPQAQLDEYADKLILNSAQSSFTKLYE